MKNPIPLDEWNLIEPILPDVKSMIELGNKRNKNGVYKHFFESQGIKHVSIDENGKDGALPLDLRDQIDLIDIDIREPVDLVTNIGTSEHVDPQGMVWHNMFKWLKPGGFLLSITPMPGHWKWHGKYYPTWEWYLSLQALNRLHLIQMHEDRSAPRRNIYFLAQKTVDVEFQIPPDEAMFINK
jgi:hypothetical protein